jgi:acetyl-CoA acetyltransferase
MGLCEAGEGVDWVRESPVPYNTSGGQLAEVYLQGMGQIAEMVKQLRGEAISQVAHADYGFVGSAALMSGALLKRGLT